MERMKQTLYPPSPLPRKQTAANAFYGSVEGRAGSKATRQGTLASGITTAARSWQGSVIVELWHDTETAKHWCKISTAPGSTDRAERTIYSGPLAELMHAAGLTAHAWGPMRAPE